MTFGSAVRLPNWSVAAGESAGGRHTICEDVNEVTYRNLIESVILLSLELLETISPQYCAESTYQSIR